LYKAVVQTAFNDPFAEKSLKTVISSIGTRKNGLKLDRPEAPAPVRIIQKEIDIVMQSALVSLQCQRVVATLIHDLLGDGAYLLLTETVSAQRSNE
jgi:hypothetical protein